jgi:ribonuclease R
VGKSKNHKQKPPRRKSSVAPASDSIPPISVLVITGLNEDGELIAEPAKWDPKRKPPHIIVSETSGQPAAAKGDRVLAKMRKLKHGVYHATVIRALPSEQPKNILGVFMPSGDGGIIEPISRKIKESYMVAAGDTLGATRGELVSGVTQTGVTTISMTYAKITERLGRIDAPRAASLIASNLHSLPQVFSTEALAESQAAAAPVMEEGRVDLRDIPLVTIDGEDARDFDDAVFAQTHEDGFHIIVAIADVAYYVAEDSALDADAFERGNSVYFPDRVIPMLPERLSNGLCSLVPNEDRYCLAVHIWINGEGMVKKYEFVRGLMRSAARLTYEQVEKEARSTLVENLYAAYGALAVERDRRGALNLNLPEFKIKFNDAGNVASITPKPQLESHRLIESFMIAANVAAADYLLKHKKPGIYRVHETPSDEKLEDLSNLLKIAGYSLHVGSGIRASHFNRILKQVEGKPEAYLVNTSILRSQMQAYYSNENLGHFGLSLQKYCHFTSPIRRYSDLVVHRSLAQLIAGAEKEKNPSLRLADIALHISDTERRAMLAERDASDRYKVAYMSNHVGSHFMGVIVSLNEYGLFVSLNDNGVTGFIPVRNLQGDFFHYDKKHACFKGQRTHKTYHIGEALMINVQAANTVTSSLIFEIATGDTQIQPPLRPTPHAPKRNKDRHRDRKNKGKRRKPAPR